jgi:hypothetical protein
MKKIISLSEAIDSRGPKILVYGASGSGKTSLAPSLGDGVLVASAEHGLRSIAGASGVDAIEIECIQDLRDACAHAVKYRWLVCDSITEIATVLLGERKAATPDPRQAYGAIIDEIGAVVRSMRDLPCGVLCIAHEESDIDELTKKRYVRPMMPGSKLGPSLPYVFDEVYRLFVDGDKRRIRTATDGVVTAKSRSYTLDPVMDVTDNGLAEVLERLQA